MGGMGAFEVESDDRAAALGREPRKLRLIDQWFDTSPKTTARTIDLPLFDPPRPSLTARREGEEVVVSIGGLTTPISTRWEADGDLIGGGPEGRRRPMGPARRGRAAVRRGGRAGGGPARPLSARWGADGDLIGDGPGVRWRPLGPADRVRVAIRSRGGVAVLSL